MISQDQVAQIARFAEQQVLSEKVVSALREKFSGIHFTYCMDDDVTNGSAVFESPAFNLYLVDSSEHCLRFTQDNEMASGVVIAEVEDDDL